jgi:hypothetical protein
MVGVVVKGLIEIRIGWWRGVIEEKVKRKLKLLSGGGCCLFLCGRIWEILRGVLGGSRGIAGPGRAGPGWWCCAG